jgi:response regulator RpfG family c-di-GMP phosphodiesterase
MKVLIADDVPDIREIIMLMIDSHYEVTWVEASDGLEAVHKIQSEGPFDLVISDYNMPGKNGGKVLQELRKLYPRCPFILVSTESHLTFPELKDDTHIDSINKPFNEELLLSKLKILGEKNTAKNWKEGYVPLSLETLKKISMVGCPLFLRLGENHYLKVLKADAPFSDSEAQRFQGKSVTHLYVELIHYSEVLSRYRKDIFSQLEWDSIDATTALQALTQDWELVTKASQNFGWSKAVMEMAQENIAKTIALMEKNVDLSQLLSALKTPQQSRLAAHCYLTATFATAIIQELGWSSAQTLQKLTFASMLHDMSLDEDLFTAKQTLLNDGSLKEFTDLPEVKKILEHPIRGAEFVRSWVGCPADVDQLILQHHEKLDGTGFPSGLNFQTIFPLAGVFIIAEDIIYHCVDNFGVAPLEYLKSREEYYSRGDFKKIFSATAKALSKSI